MRYILATVRFSRKRGIQMILPKGITEYEKPGGEEVMGEVLKDVREKKTTGYLLVLGNLEEGGETKDVTGQMVFKEGEPVLCETILSSDSMKGKEGIHPILKTMMVESNRIELHTKIDVGPPMAFFKECQIAAEEIDLQNFMERLKEEEEKKRKRAERTREIGEKVRGYAGAGYEISDIDSRLSMDYEELEGWFSKLEKNIQRIGEIRKWLEGMDDVELQSEKEELMGFLGRPEEMERIEKADKKLREKMEGIEEKRNEMQKWVDLWNSEGYNTMELEEALKGDLDTAWNVLTQFMDDITHLKDLAEELKKLEGSKEATGFEKELEPVKAMIKDPSEMENIRTALDEVRETMAREKEQKEELLAKLSEWEQKGLDISKVKKLEDRRLEEVIREYNLLTNNGERILEIREELASMDRRDIPDKIDRLSGSMTDPFRLDDYETSLNELKDEIDALAGERSELLSEVEEIKARGIVIGELEKGLDSPVSELRSSLGELKGKLDTLQELKDRIDQMDQRWMEEKFAVLDELLNDPEKIEEIEDTIEKLESRIKEREERRKTMRAAMDSWKSQGFKVEELESVIDGPPEDFTSAYESLSIKIERGMELLNRLNSLDTTFFPSRFEEARALVLDPDLHGRAEEAIGELEEQVKGDLARREAFKEELSKLKKDGWKTEGSEAILELPPDELDGAMNSFNETLQAHKDALEDIETWDQLESKLLKDEIKELKKGLMDLDISEETLKVYSDLKERIGANTARRQEMNGKLEEWAEAGYIVDEVSEKKEGPLQEYEPVFEEMNGRIGRLEELQKEFDSLNTAHFKTEAEDIEFKLNDPSLVDQIEVAMEELSKKIDEDRKKRGQYLERIENYINDGFGGAAKLRDVMDEDLSIVELEFKNFEKEVNMLKKYMETTGFKKAQSEPAPKKEEAEKKKGEAVKEERASAGKKAEEAAEEKDEDPSRSFGMKLVEKFTFENFVVGSSNRFAAKAAEAVADHPADAYNPLFIYGGTGLGKTHLINAIGHKIGGKKDRMKVIYVTTEKFTNDLINSISGEDLDGFRDFFRKADVLLVDDIEFISGKEATQEEFFNTFNHLHNNGRQVVVASDRPPKEIPKLTDRLKSRFEGGLIVDIAPPTMETKVVIIKREAKKLGITLNDEVVHLVADRITTNIRALEGAVKRLAAKVKMDGVPADEKLAEEILADVLVDEEGDLSQTLEMIKKKITDLKDDVGDEILKGKEQGEGETEGEAGEQPPVEEEMVKCTNCEKLIPANSAVCPECGVSFEGEVYECPLCHSEVPAGSDKCPSCGAVFEV